MVKIASILASIVAVTASAVAANPCPFAESHGAAAHLEKRDTPYQGIPAADQQAYSWGKTVDPAVVGKHQSWPFLSLPRLFLESMNPTVATVSDELPNERVKQVHSAGAVAKAQFIADANSPYTGVFQGADHAILRFSLATEPSSGNDDIVPAAALKFFRDNTPSANIFFMIGIQAQHSQNFFKSDFSTHLCTTNAGVSGQVLLTKFNTAPSKWGAFIGTSDAASIDQHGNKVDQPHYPFHLVMRPTAAVAPLIPDHNPTKDAFFSLSTLASNLPAGTDVWDVYAAETPAPAGQNPAFAHIGVIRTTSETVLSVYGDNGLFFKHQTFDDDFYGRPDWAANCPDLKNCVSCNDPVNGKSCF